MMGTVKLKIGGVQKTGAREDRWQISRGDCGGGKKGMGLWG